MFTILLVLIAVAKAIDISAAPPIIAWLCERRTTANNKGFPDGWCEPASDICTWSGIQCTRDGILTAVELFGAPVNSELDERAYEAHCGRLILRKCGLRGAISKRFEGVSNIDLADNELSGALPPGFFSSLSHVDLRANKLTSVGNMCTSSSLHTLLLANNQFADDLSHCTEASDAFAKNLRSFDISDNKFWGIAPFGKGVAKYSISNNQFVYVQDARPLERHSLISIFKYLGTETEKDSLRLVRCEIGKSAFASEPESYDNMWFRADSEISVLCK